MRTSTPVLPYNTLFPHRTDVVVVFAVTNVVHVHVYLVSYISRTVWLYTARTLSAVSGLRCVLDVVSSSDGSRQGGVSSEDARTLRPAGRAQEADTIATRGRF